MRSAMRSTGFPLSRPGRYLLAVASLALALTGGTCGAAMAGVTAGPGGGRLLPRVVRTDHGLVRGLYQHGAREFLGIPYAAPPTGANAWRPPPPPPPPPPATAPQTPGPDFPH